MAVLPDPQTQTPWPLAIWLPTTLLLILLITVVHDLVLWRRMPPGPPPLPFIGNKHQLPRSKPWLQFEKWSHVYGPIYTIWIGRRPTLVLSDPRIASELLEKRSSKYSSRPRMVAMGEVYWDNASILVQPYGRPWSIRRKLLHQAMTPRALQSYKAAQEAEASRLCGQLVARPESWEKLLERFTSSVVFAVSYGHRIDSLNARVIRDRFDFMQYAAGLNVPGKYLVETFPALKHLPNFLAPWKRDIQEHGKREARANMALVDMVRADVASATAKGELEDLPPSLCRLLLAEKEKTHIPLSERDFSYIPASLFGAGSDTTASTLCSAFLGFVTHPNVLRRAQAEVDAVVGLDRSPTFEDEKRLPYIRALVKEVLRWRPVAVLGGTPHASTEDDYYEGWYVPRGTTILGNSWAINTNELYYPEPHLFEPLRFWGVDGIGDGSEPATALDEKEEEISKRLKGELNHPAKSGHSSFGWGRRICPGADLATNSLFVALAKIVWALEVLPIDGRVYDIFDYTEGFNTRPKSLAVTVQVRSERHRDVLRREVKEAEAVLEKFTPFQE